MPWKGARIRGSWARGFKMPSFYALAQPFIGNRALRPETSSALDAGFDQSLGRRLGEFHVNIFRSVYGDLVDFSPQLFRLVNRSEALTRGVDVSWRLRLPHAVVMQIHGTYTSVFLKGSSEVLRDRPRWRTGSIVSAPIGGRSTIFAEGLWVGSRFDFQTPVPQFARARSYFVANIGVDRRMNEKLTVFARVENVLDRAYQEYVGFPNAGASARAGLRFLFR
jgi:outer membrane receptor protein involved in Fe transport